MNKHQLAAIALLIAMSLIPIVFPIFGYSQDPRSCADPRTQYPSNPPCTK